MHRHVIFFFLTGCVITPLPTPPPPPTTLPSPVYPNGCVEDWYAKARLPMCVENWITELTSQQKTIEKKQKISKEKK